MDAAKYYELLDMARGVNLTNEASRAEAIDILHEAMVLLDGDTQRQMPAFDMQDLAANLLGLGGAK